MTTTKETTDIDDLTLAVCALAKAVAELALVEGYRTNAVQGAVPYKDQLSPHAVEENCIQLRIEVDAIEKQVRKRL